MSRKRKQKRNIGGAVDTTPPSREAAFDAILLPERIIQELLQQTIDQLKTDEPELTRFFSHFFVPTAGADEVTEFVKHFMRRPPKALLGYARTSASFPCFAVVMMSENEEDAFVGDFAGQHDATFMGPDPSEFSGAFFSAEYGIFVYAEHPDACAYLYQFAKAVIHAGKQFLLGCGIIDLTLSGGELTPDESYMPDNMFMRVLRINARVPLTVPRLLLAHPARIQLTGLFGSDVVVDGLRGGVKTYTPEDEDGT